MVVPEDISSLSRENLLTVVAELQRQLAEARATIEALRAEIAQLKRSTKRQAAPFSKGIHVSKPKRPGRKPGTGIFSYRKAPLP